MATAEHLERSSTPSGQDGPSSGPSLLVASIGGLLALLGVAAGEASVRDVPFWGLVGLSAVPAGVLSFGAWLIVRLFRDPELAATSLRLPTNRSRYRVLLGGLLIVLCWHLIGQLGVELMVTFGERPAAGAALLSLVAVGLLAFASYLVDWVAAAFCRRLPVVSPRLAWGGALFLFASGASVLILLGETSGLGGPLALFGVFRREELNLVPALSALAIFATAGLVAAVLPARGPRALRGVAWLAPVGLAVFSLRAAQVLSPRDAVRVERSQGLGRVLLPWAQRMTDRDGDGSSAWFGGGDCNDDSARIRPGLPDVPGNGVDEDCSGADAAVQPSAEPASQPRVAAPPARLEKANVLLLTVDTLRYDLGYMHPEGERPRLSPRLDALARRSTIFSHAYALASYTSKSLGPMLIGRYPSETARTFEHFDRFGAHVPFIQERIRAAGHRTLSAQAYWYFFFKGYGFERGFDVLDHTAAPRAVAIEGDKSVTGGKLADVVSRELEQLETHQGQFFFWAHWVDPHAEYVPHAEFDFGTDSRQRYDGEVAYVDAAIGRVLDTLEASSFADRTVVIVTSDHGEAFGEHGMIRHGFEVWEELVRVPLLVFVPGAPPGRIDVPRSIIDVAPTILDALDLPLPAEEGERMRGESLLLDVGLAADQAPAERPVLVDMPQGPHNQERRAFIWEGKKLITSQGRPIGLFDLRRDPGEKDDLSENAELLQAIQARMAEFLARLEPVPASR